MLRVVGGYGEADLRGDGGGRLGRGAETVGGSRGVEDEGESALGLLLETHSRDYAIDLREICTVQLVDSDIHSIHKSTPSPPPPPPPKNPPSPPPHPP